MWFKIRNSLLKMQWITYHEYDLGHVWFLKISKISWSVLISTNEMKNMDNKTTMRKWNINNALHLTFWLMIILIWLLVEQVILFVLSNDLIAFFDDNKKCLVLCVIVLCLSVSFLPIYIMATHYTVFTRLIIVMF